MTNDATNQRATHLQKLPIGGEHDLTNPANANSRIATLRDSLESLEIDAILVTDPTNVRYLSGFTGDSSYLFVGRERAEMLSDGRYEIQLSEQCPNLRTVIRPPSQLIMDLVKTVINESGDRRIGIEASDVTLGQYQELCEKCPDVHFVATESVIQRQRMVKDAHEIAIVRQSVQIAQRSFQSLLPMLSTKWSERAIAHELEAKMRFLGAEGASFKPIVAFNAAGALPHYEPADLFLPSQGTVLIDWGARFKGYASDLTRTMTIGTISDKFEHAYQSVLEAQLAAIEAIRPGAEGKDIDRIVREKLEKAGYGKEFNHGLGHGFGLEIHESPRMSPNCEHTLLPGMIITVEPGVYLSGQFGIRIEDDVLVTENGCERLSDLPKGLDDCRLVL
ncbi:putative peptidase [Novipirellula aureliae]|uniref:Putative peptidase n=1 Tax=Novipirellula aureliae TaxID=2527966 RepID=A0A5C6DU27_9BACT|nr:Xaa-Pro peptidase family protein [Novipirellula aureliae]TWU38951.1 putative peptidase [Novipirellula aureliae]